MLVAVFAGALLALAGQAYDVLESAAELLAGIEFHGDEHDKRRAWINRDLLLR